MACRKLASYGVWVIVGLVCFGHIQVYFTSLSCQGHKCIVAVSYRMHMTV
jgi:abortive infection bacteriophage resistance protein